MVPGDSAAPGAGIGQGTSDGASAAAAAGNGSAADYVAVVRAWLERHKRYPRLARQRGTQGVAVVVFSIRADGTLLSHQVAQSSGHASLDRAAADMVERASPFPPVPPGLGGGRLTLTVPVDFSLR